MRPWCGVRRGPPRVRSRSRRWGEQRRRTIGRGRSRRARDRSGATPRTDHFPRARGWRDRAVLGHARGGVAAKGKLLLGVPAEPGVVCHGLGDQLIEGGSKIHCHALESVPELLSTTKPTQPRCGLCSGTGSAFYSHPSRLDPPWRTCTSGEFPVPTTIQAHCNASGGTTYGRSAPGGD